MACFNLSREGRTEIARAGSKAKGKRSVVGHAFVDASRVHYIYSLYLPMFFLVELQQHDQHVMLRPD